MSEILKDIFTTLGSAVGKNWRNKDFMNWIIEGIDSNPLKDERILSRMERILEGEFGSCGMVSFQGDEKSVLKLTVFMSYLGSVKYDFVPLKRALLGLRVQEQRVLEGIFTLLLEEKWDDALLKDPEEPSSSGGNPSVMATTPLTRFRKFKPRKSPSTFCYSPSSNPSLPLKEFFSSPVTTQIAKYQRLVDEKNKVLRSVRLELDQEKVEMLNLRKEKEELLKDRKSLRDSLESARHKLYSLQSGVDGKEDEDEEEKEAYETLKMKLAERKDSEQYIASLESQSREILDEKRDLERRVENQRTKLEERFLQNSQLESRMVELQASLTSAKDQNRILNDNCEELEGQVEEFREMIASRRSTLDGANQLSHLAGSGGSSWSMRYSIGGVSVADISMDEPLVSTPESPMGENMAETLIIPQLEDNLAQTKQELEVCKNKALYLEENLNSQRNKSDSLSAELQVVAKMNEEHMTTLDSLNSEKNAISQSLKDMKKEYAELKEANLSSKIQLDHYKKLNSELEERAKDLQNTLNKSSALAAELKKSNQEELSAMASVLSAKESSLEELLKTGEDSKAALEQITEEKINLEKLNVEFSSKVVSLEEELQNIRFEWDNEANEYRSQSMKIESELSAIKDSLKNREAINEQLVSSNESLVSEKGRLLKEVNDCKIREEELNDLCKKAHNETKFLKDDIITLTNDKESLKNINGSLKEKIDDAESRLHEYQENYSNRIKSLEKEITDSKTKEEVIVKKYENDVSKIKLELSNELVQKKKELSVLQTEMTSLREELKAKHNDILLIRNELKDEFEQKECSKKDLDEKKRNCQLVESERDALKLALKESETKLNEKEKELETLISDKTKLGMRIVTLEEKRTSDLQDINDKKNQLTSLEGRLHNATMNLDGSHEISNKLSAKNEELLSEIDTLKSLNNKLIEEVQSYTEEIAKLQKDKLLDDSKHTMAIMQLNNTISSKELDLEELKNQLNESQIYAKGIAETLHQEELKVNSYELENKSLNEIKSGLEKDISNLHLKISKCEHIEASLKEELNSQENSIRMNMETEYLNLKRKYEEMVKSHTEGSSKINSLTESQASLKEETFDLTVQVEDLNSKLRVKEQEVYELTKKVNSLLSEKSAMEAQNSELTAEINKAAKTVDNCEKDVVEINQALSRLESENIRLKLEIESSNDDKEFQLKESRVALDKLRSELEEREIETLTQIGKYQTQNSASTQNMQALKEELKKSHEMVAKYASEERSLRASFEEKLKKELESLKKDMEEKAKMDLSAQKTRYEGRVKEIAETVSKQYKDKFEEYVKKCENFKEKDVEIEKLKKVVLSSKAENAKSKTHLKEYEDKYSMAKTKITELAEKIGEMSVENEALLKKYNATKDVIKTLKTEKEKALEEIERLNSFSSQSMEIERLKRQITKIKTENRQLSVQFSAAETKIKQLQKDVESRGNQFTSYNALPSSSRGNATPSPKPVFKMPSTKNTPGRAKSGRTQSESQIVGRRPPTGAGALFNVDDEEGEMFSNSYLSDVKEGRCNVDNGRISELSRRNTMQPAHLKSSYPVETQFYDADSFKDSDLKAGKVINDVHSITTGTANLSMSSPAMSTRSRRLTIASTTTSDSSPSSRKRGGVDGSFNSTSSFTLRSEAKRSRKEAHQTSYSKPGPPTPARNRSINSNSSINKSAASVPENGSQNTPSAKTRTPLIDSTNRSLKSRIAGTPLSLRKAVSGAWRKRKSYDMKARQDKGVSLVVVSPAKRMTPIKRFMKKK